MFSAGNTKSSFWLHSIAQCEYTVTKGCIYRSGTSGAKILRIEIFDCSPKMLLLFILQSIMLAYAYFCWPLVNDFISLPHIFAYMKNYSHNLHFLNSFHIFKRCLYFSTVWTVNVLCLFLCFVVGLLIYLWKILYIYLFFAVLGLWCCTGFPLVAVSRGYSRGLVAFFLWRLLLLQSTGSRKCKRQWLGHMVVAAPLL